MLYLVAYEFILSTGTALCSMMIHMVTGHYSGLVGMFLASWHQVLFPARPVCVRVLGVVACLAPPADIIQVLISAVHWLASIYGTFRVLVLNFYWSATSLLPPHPLDVGAFHFIYLSQMATYQPMCTFHLIKRTGAVMHSSVKNHGMT